MAKSLMEKLGFKPGMRCRVEGAPDVLKRQFATSEEGPYDLLLYFVRDAAAIECVAATAAASYRDGARLWFAYPKRSGAIRTDIDRDRGWEPVHALGLLGVSQIAVDETWSALRFRRRHEIDRLTRRF